MFNPASILFVLAALCGLLGFVQLAGSASPVTLSALPETAATSATSRQANRSDEYALLLAHYGQPSAVTTTQVGSVPLRTATWANAQLAVDLVPAGCVQPYLDFQSLKAESPPSRSTRRHRVPNHALQPVTSPCVPPADKASTIVGYKDVATGLPTDSETALRDLSMLSPKSKVPPVSQTPDMVQANRHELRGTSQPQSVEYDERTLRDEQRRIYGIETTSRKEVKIASGFLTGAVLILLPGVLVYRNNKEKRMTQLVYDLSGVANTQQQVLDSALEQLSKSKAIWRLDSQLAISDWKRNAGASYNVKREQISVLRAVPPRVESNLVPICIDLGKRKMFFLPDQVLYWQRGTFASIEYRDLNFHAASTRFIEEQVQASDSQQVGSTWRYVRKDGGPDRRFNNNQQLPVMLYGVVTAASSGGLNLMLHTSNVSAASSFAASFKAFQSSRDRYIFDEMRQTLEEVKTDKKRQKYGSCPENIEKAFVLLGLRPEATLDQVTVAYRQMSQMYHPDKVIGLGPELQNLANERMREINAAHQLLRKYFEGI